jgi:SAM-dependent methyltransferase
MSRVSTDTALFRKLDIGCGSNKKPGFAGLDKLEVPGVDIVADFEQETLPLESDSVEEIYSYHCLEHLRDPTHLFSEMGRILQVGGKMELWVPYAFSGSAFLPDHKFYYTEEIFLHICVLYQDFWKNITGSYWRLDAVVFVSDPSVEQMLAGQSIPLGFGIRFLKDVCQEIGIFMTDCGEEKPSYDLVPRFSALSMHGERTDISSWWPPLVGKA